MRDDDAVHQRQEGSLHMRSILLVLLALLVMAAPARGGFDTGAALLAACEDPDGSGYGPMYCLGYITAVADVLEQNAVNSFRACTPPDVTVGDLLEVVKGYLGRHPERGGYGAAGLIAHALGEAYPCS